MLVVLGLFLFQAKARIVMTEARTGPLPRRRRLRRYLVWIALWAVLAGGVMFFALTR